MDGLASPAVRKGIRDQPGFSRPSRRAISASSDSRSAKGSSTVGGGLTLKLAFAFCGGGRASPPCCAPLDAGAEGCCVLATGSDGALAAGTLAAGGVARGSAFAAATAESTFSERGGALGAAGGGVDGLPWADEEGLPGADEAFGGPFSVRRVMGGLLPDPLAGAIGGGIAGRGGVGRGGGELAGAGRVGSAACAACGEAGGEDTGRPCSDSVGRGIGAFAVAGPAAAARGTTGGGAAARAAAGARGAAGAGAAGDAAAGDEAGSEAATFAGGASAATGAATAAASVRRPGAPGARRGRG